MKIILSSKRHHYLVRVNIFLITVALVVGTGGSTCPGPSFPPSEDLEIRDWYDLDAVRDNMNGNHILMNDLDSTTAGYEELAGPAANEGKGWDPIGTPSNVFFGDFNGQGYEIRDLSVKRPNENFIGLFGFVCYAGAIEDVGVVNATVTGFSSVGGLVGENLGTVSNCYSTGNVAGNSSVGGLVGWNEEGTVSNCYSTGNVAGNSSVGGLVGWNEEGTVSNSFWDIETSGQATSDGGTGKNTTEMQDIATFSGAGWSIIAVALNQTNPTYIWNIVNGVTYPFLSW